MMERMEIIQELSALFSGADVYLMPHSEAELRAYLTEVVSPRFGVDLGKHGGISQIRALDSDNIYEFTPLPGIAALVYVAASINKIIFIGPVTTESYTTHHFASYLQQQNIPSKMMEQLIDTTSHLPTMSSYQLYRLMDIVLRHVCSLDIPVPVKKIEPSYSIPTLSPLSDIHIPKDIHQIRLVEDRYKVSSMLTEAVKLGNLSLAMQALPSRETHHDALVRNQNPLRNMQNQCIILNTQLRHSLESCGIHPYPLDQLSGEIGTQIERLNNPAMLTAFTTYIIEQYCHLVQEQSYQNLSPLTHQAVVYIKNNLSGNLTVKDTALELAVNPDYLSHQFSTEMGMTFIEFLNQERCVQAASFLKHTNLQIKEISAIVGFNTISYFTKQFVKAYHKTPRDFRNERIYRRQAAPAVTKQNT